MKDQNKKPPVTDPSSTKDETSEASKADDRFVDLIKQVNVEYQLAYNHQKHRFDKNLTRLKLYSNQRKQEDAVGDVTLFGIHQTLLATFYNDELEIEFAPTEEGDTDAAESLTMVAKHDYKKMKKEQLDYYWLWDTLFDGRGLLKLHMFDRDKKRMCPVPELIDALTFLHDPKAKSVHGLMNNEGAMRFGGRPLWMTKNEMKEEYGFFDVDKLKSGEEVKSLLKELQQARDEAQGLNGQQYSDADLGANQSYELLEWYTHWINPKTKKIEKVIIVLGNERSLPVKFEVLSDGFFPLVDRPLYPSSQDWHGTSIPDLVEDKQRQKSVAMNLTLQSMKADLYPMYLYDENRIKNRADLLKFKFNKFVGVQGDGDIRGAVQPMNKATPRMDLVSWVLNTLDASAQLATATPDMQQGQIGDQQRTLGELNLISSKVDTRYSLTAKVFGWSEELFWNIWYFLYKKHFKDKIDEKFVRIVGAFGTRWRKIQKEDLELINDPDIYIQSKRIGDAKAAQQRIAMQGYTNLVLSDPTSNANKRYLLKINGKLNGLAKDQIERIFPPTVDELVAEDENKKLDENKLMEVNVNDDHVVHYEVHAKASDTPAKAAHMAAHRQSMIIRRDQPQLFQNKDGTQPTGNEGMANITQPGTTINQLTPSKVASPTFNEQAV